MTYHQLRAALAQALEAFLDPAEASAEAHHWMSEGLGKDRAWLACKGAGTVPAKELRQVRAWLDRRRKGEPLAQILGWASFFGRRFQVSRDVMIPRPHSEAAAREALRWGRELGVAAVVDVGTGCGNLAITLALEGGWRVAATEVCPRALGVARGNAKVLGAQVGFHLGSLLEPLVEPPELVVANLPYVDPTHLPEMANELAFEPQIALVSPGSGLSLNGALLLQAKAKGARACLLELGPGQGDGLREVAREAGWEQVQVFPDSLGHDHLLRASG